MSLGFLVIPFKFLKGRFGLSMAEFSVAAANFIALASGKLSPPLSSFLLCPPPSTETLVPLPAVTSSGHVLVLDPPLQS